DFEAKYQDAGAVRLDCPAQLPQTAAGQIQSLAVRAFEVIGAEGLARVDFFLDPAGRPVCNEINTMPGFTPFSLYPRMWEAAGLGYGALITELVELALARPTGLR
ncbi:MAG: D-alanine--D-alanine ligase A, partial [Bifidobacteriaceae bacterium]|nr:D-alanine--D-alanine ligase A [Bifidobacteriaceae bacterium]